MESQATEAFVQSITQYQRRLSVYVRSLVTHRQDAEEVLQEVNLYLWRNAAEFEPGTEFGAWAYRVAYFHVLTYRKRMARQRLRLSDALVEQLASGAEAVAEATDRRADALEQCLNKLAPSERQLLEMRYGGELPVQAVADKVGRALKTVYATLNRIHLALLACIQQTLQTEVTS